MGSKEINAKHSSQWNGDIIQWHEITMDEKQKIQTFYSFLSISYKGSVFFQYHTKKLKLPQKILVRLNLNGDILHCIDKDNNIIFEMPFDSEISIIDPKDDNHNDISKESKDSDDDMEDGE